MVDYDYDLPPNHPAEAGGSPLSSLTADQLAEKVRGEYGRWREPYLVELQTRANQRDNLAGLEELLAQTEERVRLLKIYALAVEKERDEWEWKHDARGVEMDVILQGREAAETRLAETRKALEQIANIKPGGVLYVGGKPGTVQQIARAALTTHPEGKP